MRQAYDYWQDQPGNYRDSGALSHRATGPPPYRRRPTHLTSVVHGGPRQATTACKPSSTRYQLGDRRGHLRPTLSHQVRSIGDTDRLGCTSLHIHSNVKRHKPTAPPGPRRLPADDQSSTKPFPSEPPSQLCKHGRASAVTPHSARTQLQSQTPSENAAKQKNNTCDIRHNSASGGA